jgi:glutamyl-tRNA synthetase
MYERQLADLAAIGVDWDGSVVRQSERTELYEEALGRLDAYPCWCTRAEIREAASAPHGELPEGAYPGTCRDLSARQRAERERSGRPPALRLRANGERVRFVDELRGPQAGVVDDFVLRRGDGAFAYNLAVVVDDADQGVDQVVRGDDLIDSTPRQLLLTRLLGAPEPRYAHVPLMLGSDGARLAKRHGAVTLADRRARGETPDQVRALLAASLGLEDLTPGAFDPTRLPREPTVLDPT